MDFFALQDFAETLKAKFSLPGSASPEDQLKPPVAGLFVNTGATFELNVETLTEARLAEQKVQPDIAIYSSGLICGYVELKAPGLGTDAPKLKGKHNKEQWEKLKGLPNLIYTDGREWALYRTGERKGDIVRFADDPVDEGKRAVVKDDASKLNALLLDFLSWTPTVPHEPTALAKYLAPLARFLRSEVEAAMATTGSDINALAAEYDPKLRRDYGVYYTPREVVELQVRLASELLEKRFDKKLGFADDGVVFLDPAVGTGTYLVAAIKNALEKVRLKSGVGAVAARAAHMAEHMLGFEILVGPYAVAHLRLTQALEGAMNENLAEGEPPNALQDRLKVYLADTLESPERAPPGGLDLTHRVLTQEHEAARKVKNEGEILVCLGNPPYDRQQIAEGDTTTQKKGGWVRFGDQVRGARQTTTVSRSDFRGLSRAGAEGRRGCPPENFYNDYVYFWRWALWRLFETQECGGIVTFITASSFLGGPGFVGMREVMRREFDEIYIINIGGDLLGTRKTPNVFNIQTPVAITLGIRGKESNSNNAATTKYVRIEAIDRTNKLKQLDLFERLDSVIWEPISQNWSDPFYPKSKAEYFFWPELSDIFPWQHSGAQFKRTWPIAETEYVLIKRWRRLSLRQ